MNTNPDNIAKNLHSNIAQSPDLTALRSDAVATMARERKRIRIYKTMGQISWIIGAILATGYMWFDSNTTASVRAPFLACLLLVWGGVELLKNLIQALRLEILVEMKQQQLQIAELASKQPGAQ